MEVPAQHVVAGIALVLHHAQHAAWARPPAPVRGWPASGMTLQWPRAPLRWRQRPAVCRGGRHPACAPPRAPAARANGVGQHLEGGGHVDVGHHHGTGAHQAGRHQGLQAGGVAEHHPPIAGGCGLAHRSGVRSAPCRECLRAPACAPGSGRSGRKPQMMTCLLVLMVLRAMVVICSDCCIQSLATSFITMRLLYMMRKGRGQHRQHHGRQDGVHQRGCTSPFPA